MKKLHLAIVLAITSMSLVSMGCPNKSNPTGTNNNSPNNSLTYTFLVTGNVPACDIDYSINGVATVVYNGCVGTPCGNGPTPITLPWSYSFNAQAGVTYNFGGCSSTIGPMQGLLEKNGITVNSTTSYASGCGECFTMTGTLP
jgi:hypothetical protein